MKCLLSIRTVAAFCIVVLAAGSPVRAQTTSQEGNPAESPAAPTRQLTPTRAPAPDEAQTLKLQLASEPVPVAVDELQHALRDAHLPELNVLIAPAVKEQSIPELTLRNVTGSDALRLIAASANCEIETIVGDGKRTIGYRIVPGQPAAAFEWKSGFGGGALSQSDAAKQNQIPVGMMPSADKAIRLNPGKPGIYPVPIGQAGKTPRNVTIEPAASNEVITFTSPGGPRPAVRVYPVGGIINTIPYADIEETLRELFKLEGLSGNAAELALHKRTNVLVVKGDNPVHELVTQLLEALQKNAAATAAATAESNQAPAIGKIIADVERKQKELAKEQAQRAEAKAAEAARELEKRKLAEPQAR